MAKLPQRHAGRLAGAGIRGAVALAAVLVSAGAPLADEARAEAPPIALEGTWHVLIHYTDDHAHDPTQMRWDGKIWVFEKSGSRLRWTEYPIVVFQDQTGRFENLGGSRAARVVHGWEPNEAQRAQIAKGLEVNRRGSVSKTLRAGEDGSWQSATRPSSAAANVITYVQNWSITDPTTQPVFRREDLLGSAASEGYDGVTLFETTEVGPKGRTLSGRFERDGTRHGTFRLTRSGDASDVKGSGKSDGQRFFEMFLGAEFTQALYGIKAAQAAQESGEVDRAAVRAQVRAAIEGLIDEQDVDPAEYEREVESLTRQVTRLLVDEGLSADEIVGRIVEGKLNP